MRKLQIKLLENLVKIPSPSGYEEQIAEFLRQELLTVLPKTRVKIDSFNNVIAIIPGITKQVVMIDAHLDQVAYIVNNIDKKGFISLQYIGGGDKSILSARNLIILSDKGKINAVVNRKHCHIIGEEEGMIENLWEAVVDIGPRNRREVISVVKVGDPVIYEPHFRQLRKSFYSGYCFDDAAGCFILIETIKEIIHSKKKPVPTLVFTFSSQEETGGQKCKPLVKQYAPNLFIECDVTFATDWEDDDNLEREVGKCDLGKGIVLYRGVGIDKSSFKMIQAISNRYRIKTQIQASSGDIGYSSDYVTSLEKGIKTLILGIPLRNMHYPCEIINLNDLNYGIQLLTNFLLYKKIGNVLEN